MKTPNDLIQTLESALAITKELEPTPWTLPPPPAGQQWHRTDGWTKDMLPEGYRPLLKDEVAQAEDRFFLFNKWAKPEGALGGKINQHHLHARTTRPLPEPPATPKAWDCVADLGFPWPLLKHIDSEETYAISSVSSRHVQIGTAFLSYYELASYEHSRDGIKFSPCHKTK